MKQRCIRSKQNCLFNTYNQYFGVIEDTYNIVPKVTSNPAFRSSYVAAFVPKRHLSCFTTVLRDQDKGINKPSSKIIEVTAQSLKDESSKTTSQIESTELSDLSKPVDEVQKPYTTVLKDQDKGINKPSSQIEVTVQALKDKASKTTSQIESTELSDLPKPVDVVKKSIATRIKEEILHYFTGFKLLFIDIKICSKYVWRLTKGDTLTRREHRQVGCLILLNEFIIIINTILFYSSFEQQVIYFVYCHFLFSSSFHSWNFFCLWL